MSYRKPNDVLRDQMDMRKLTREGLAERVCAKALELTGEPVACTARQVGRWLSGEVRWPWLRYRQPLEAVFGLPAEDLGFVSSGDPQAEVPVTPPVQHQGPPVLRRHFILGLGSVLALPTLPTTGRLGISDVENIKAATTQLDQLDDRHGGADLADVVARYVEHIEHSVRRCTYGSMVQGLLYAAVGELAANGGWFAFDGGRQDEARRQWHLALYYATLAGDTMLQARVWAGMARQAAELGHGGEAVAIARVALDSTRSRREPRLSALLHTRVALGHSLTGERGRSAQSMMRAEQMLDRAGDTLPWLAFCGPGEVVGQAALCDFNLGRYGDAVHRDLNAASLVSPAFVRNSFATQVSLARNQLAAGDGDAALAAGHRALDLLPAVRSPRWSAHLKTFAHDIQHRGPVEAAVFAERYEAATR